MRGLQLAVNQSEPSNALLRSTYRGLPDGHRSSGNGREEMTIT